MEEMGNILLSRPMCPDCAHGVLFRLLLKGCQGWSRKEEMPAGEGLLAESRRGRFGQRCLFPGAEDRCQDSGLRQPRALLPLWPPH